MKRLFDKLKKNPTFRKGALLVIGFTRKSWMFLNNKLSGVNKNKVVFSSFLGKSYSDNPKAISEKLHKLHPEYEIVWAFTNPDKKQDIIPDYVRCIRAGTWEELREMATAKCWVDNFCKQGAFYKSRDQYYVQTWHGDRGFKRVLYDVRTLLPNGHYKEGDLLEPKICTLAVSGSKYGDKVFRSAFGYLGEILTMGCPRNDQLVNFDESNALKVKKALNIDERTMVLMYAPTFRDSKKREKQISHINLKEVIQCLEEKTDSSWICLIRAHSIVSGFDLSQTVEDKILDVTLYEDMGDLLLISDMLITDYSSSAGDFALLKRPVVLFQDDRKEYLEKDRTFYFDMDQSPFLVAMNQEELIDIIKNLDDEKAASNCSAINEFYGTVETGRSSDAVAEYIASK